MNTVEVEVKELGFKLSKGLWNIAQTKKASKTIIENIATSAKQLACSTECYLKVISRWTHPSPITESLYLEVKNDFGSFLKNIFQKEAILVELAVIRKSKNANRATPCHQDIAYTPENYYDFSVWLPLQDVSLEDGVLEVLPGSHLDQIEPPVDYWQPHFIDQKHLSSLWQNNYKTLPLKAGDCVLFDSRLWHRSDANRTGCDRLAIATRWRILADKPSYDIPKKVDSEFGIWTCGEVTKKLLQQGLNKTFQLSYPNDLSVYISQWLDVLRRGKKLPFAVNTKRAQNALKELLILHKASERHNGGDMQGIIYPAVWETFLNPLSQWLKTKETF